MAQKALSMRKIKEVLGLRYDLALLQNEMRVVVPSVNRAFIVI
jgi:hypothetical protein